MNVTRHPHQTTFTVTSAQHWIVARRDRFTGHWRVVEITPAGTRALHNDCSGRVEAEVLAAAYVATRTRNDDHTEAQR